MSLLKQNKKEKKETAVITARIQTDLLSSFKSYCEENGFSVSEAVKLLIENEMNGDVYKSAPQNVYKEVTSDNPNHQFLLNRVKDALEDLDTNVIRVYPKTLEVDVDSAPPLPQVFSNDYILRPEECFDNTLSRLDVDPLENMPEEEWKAKLEELKQLRGE